MPGAIMPAPIQLASPTGSGYDEEWTIKLPRGRIFHVIELETNLAVKSTIKKVVIDIGGTPVVTATGAQLELLDKLFAKHEAAGRLVLDLSKFEYRSPQGIYPTALVTSLADDLTLKVEFGTKDALDPATPTMKGKAYVSNNPNAATPGGGRTIVPSMYEMTQYSAAAGDHDWTFPGGSQNKFLQRMIFDESEVTISKIYVKRGDRTIREITRADLEFGLRRYAGVQLQAGFLLLDFTQFGFGFNDAISTAGLNFVFETNAAGAIKTLVQGFERVA